jgi:hypothetical protein
MIQIAFDCPHEKCLTRNAAFTATECKVLDSKETSFIVMMQCSVCRNGIVAKYVGHGVPEWVAGRDRGQYPVMMADHWPKRAGPTIPNDIPENVKNYFVQAKSNLSNGHWDAAGAMFRKSLDVSLKALNPTAKGTIYDRIEALPESVGVTIAMKHWAHRVRRLGADAAHDEDPFTERETRDLQAFTEMFLTYAFTLPAMLAREAGP